MGSPMGDETGNATQARLLEVLGHADFEVLPGLYAFVPIDGGAKQRDDALACVRDGSVWSELVPVEAPVGPMTFRIFAFHFDSAHDAAGFVGWLHAHLARATGWWPCSTRRAAPRAGTASSSRAATCRAWRTATTPRSPSSSGSSPAWRACSTWRTTTCSRTTASAPARPSSTPTPTSCPSPTAPP